MKNNLFFLSLIFFALSPLKNLASGQPFVKLTENKGQWDQRILFKAALDGGACFIEKNGLTFSFYDKKKYRAFHHGGLLKSESKDPEIKFHAYKIHFENSNASPLIEKAKVGSDYENFILGNDQTKWQGNVKNYQQVFLRGIYNGIDYEMTSNRTGLKYNFHVKPNADPSSIQMRYEGVTNITLLNGALIIKLNVNEVIEQKPYAYQVIDGRTIEIKCNYKFRNNVLSFDFPNGYDKKHDLVIDPVLVFAAQSGSTADNFGMTATYDTQGNLYSGGTAFSNGYPTTTGAFSTAFTGSISLTNDIVISKYNASGTNLLYSTYFGGSETEIVSSMIVDGNDNLCFYGATGSADFPILENSYDNSFNGGSSISFVYNGTAFANGTDIFIGKLNSSGTSLLGSTYLGGSANDGLNHVNHTNIIPNTNLQEYNTDSLQFNYGDQYRGEIQVDPFNNIYITSSTRSSDFPTVNAYDNTLGGKQDAVLAKFNSALTQALFCTYLGGSENDCGNSLIVDSQMEIYVTGGTCSTNFPATSGAQSVSYNGGKTDGFIAHFNAAGNSILQATYVGTNNYDQSYFIQSDKNGDIYIYGQTLGNMPVVNYGTQVPYSNVNRHQFVIRYTSNLSTKKMATVFGSSLSMTDIAPSSFGIDKCNRIYFSGWGGNILYGPAISNMPLFQPTQSTTDGFDFYLMVLDSNANNLLYGSYFGGATSSEHVDGGTSRIDKLGTYYQSVCAGCGGNDDFPVTSGAWPNTPGNPNHSANCNNGTFKIASQINMIASQIISNTNSGCAPLTVNLINNSQNYSSYKWYLNQVMTSSTVVNPAVTFTAPGNYTISLVVNNPLACNKTDSSFVYIHVTLQSTPILASSSNTLICIGETSTLTASPAGSYSWSVGGTGSAIVVSPVVSTSYTLTGTDPSGCPITASFTQLVDNCTKTGELETENTGLMIYPNPMQEQLNIYAKAVIKTVRLFSMHEELLLETKALDPHLVQLDVKILPEGMYIVQVQFESSNISVKRVVKRE